MKISRAKSPNPWFNVLLCFTKKYGGNGKHEGFKPINQVNLTSVQFYNGPTRLDADLHNVMCYGYCYNM